MSVRSIEIICIPCNKCSGLEAKIREAIKKIELTYKLKMPFEFKTTPHLRDLARYSLNPSQAPIILVNDKVEFAGKIEPMLLQKRLEAIHRSC